MAFYINIDNCDACGNCIEVCMSNAIVDFDDFYLIDPCWCTECGSCSVFCINNAIGYAGLDISPAVTEENLELIELSGDGGLLVF